MYVFRWIGWNLDKCEKHRVLPSDVEYVVQHARTPFPRRVDDEKFLVWGQTRGGQYLQVVFLIQDDAELFVIHARPLTGKEKRRLRKHRR